MRGQTLMLLLLFSSCAVTRQPGTVPVHTYKVSFAPQARYFSTPNFTWLYGEAQVETFKQEMQEQGMRVLSIEQIN